jgi:RNA polymerase sigma-70 factor (ECF subfamily)
VVVDGDELEARITAHLDAGDRTAAVTEAIRGYGPQLLGYVHAIVRDDTAAGEVFSIACEDMWKGIAGFRRESLFRTWAYKLTWHAASRYLRDPQRSRQQRLATDDAAKLAAEVRSTTAIHLRRASKDALAEIRATLSPEEQTLLVLRIDRELSWPEIARVLDDAGEATAENTLRKRFERLTVRLRDEMKARGLLH